MPDGFGDLSSRARLFKIVYFSRAWAYFQTTTSTEFKSYPDSEARPLLDSPLTADDVSFLSEFVNPTYLQRRTMKALASRFLAESSLELYDFLSPPIAEKLDAGLRELDKRDGLGTNRPLPIPPHVAGSGSGWRIKGPPHKWRYNVLELPTGGGPSTAISPRAAQPPQALIRSLQDELFPSPPFRAWLAAVSSLIPLRYAVEARRFCPGLGYTLATSEEKEARLDVVLGLTPQVEVAQPTNGKGKERQPQPGGWHTGEWGGWEVCSCPTIPYYTVLPLTLSSATWPLMTRQTTQQYIGLVLTKIQHKTAMGIQPMGTATQAAFAATERLTRKIATKRMTTPHY